MHLHEILRNLVGLSLEMAEEIDEPTNGCWEFHKLSKLRSDKGISKMDLARESGVAVNTINSAEKRRGNRYEKLMCIFNALNQPKYYDGKLQSEDYIVRKP